MKNVIERYRVLWAARQPREQALLVALAVLVAAAVLAQLLWASHQARARLHKQIPQLRHQVETLQRKAADLQPLRAQQPNSTPVDRGALLASSTASANAAGLPEIAKLLQLEGPGRLRLRATVPFDRWLAWTAVLQRDLRLGLMSCRIEAADGPGSAKIDALFALPESG